MAEAIPLIGDRALGLREAAQLLRVSYGTVYAHRRELGFFQVGSVWRIWPEKLREATGRYNSDRPAQEELEHKKCPSESAKAPTYGTSISASQAAAELDKLLAQPINRRRRSSTTS
ncbi:helix-turn-helix domain-containing protein [Paraburkholderia caffeinitolerans]|uniref:helix-turn-helix domain-containing protein n=1 Tax=Paraburkholderia caffeinitolerans TaxID=1723730 RepID=UPI001FE42E1F|nr:helix-turn-helix domain-containing protein [Paraburkholderia caffeinitolerans]